MHTTISIIYGTLAVLQPLQMCKAYHELGTKRSISGRIFAFPDNTITSELFLFLLIHGHTLSWARMALERVGGYFTYGKLIFQMDRLNFRMETHFSGRDTHLQPYGDPLVTLHDRTKE